MVDEAEIRAWKDGLCGGEFLTEMTDDFVLEWSGQRMKADGEGVIGMIGEEVARGVEDLADERASIVEAGDSFAGDLSQCAFRAVGDQLDGVDEVLAFDLELAEAVLFGKVFDLEMFGVGFALSFELLEAMAGVFNLLLEFTALAFGICHF